MRLRSFIEKLLNSQPKEYSTSSLTDLHQHLPYTFSDERYLSAALTHPSYSGEDTYHYLSYERMEFLGDAILEMITSDWLFHEYPEASEGELTRKRASLVNRITLARCARELNIPRYLRAQTVPGNPIEESSSVLSDVVEALIGAVYLDGGLQASRTLIHFILPLEESERTEQPDNRNYKGELIEYCHLQEYPNPKFRTLDKSGPDHSRVYRVGVTLGKVPLGEGKGPSKKKAGQIAAKHALTRLKQSPELREKF